MISTIFAIIIIKSIYEGVFPDCLKIARVVSFFKGGTENNVGNYRPISLLPVFCKIFEKAVYLRIYRYLSSKYILSHYQFGFDEGRGTVNAVFDLCRYLYKELDCGRNVVSTFIDYRKDFDCVSHEILLGKLWYYDL